MNTSEQIPTMYESIPAVAELNRVPGFEPFKLLRRIASPEEGKVALQLDLRFKKLWFRLAHPKGRIRLNPLRITEQMAIFEAQVYLERGDENPVGSFTSCCTKEEAPGGQYVQAAQFEAMDEALTDAGFGVQFADVSMDAAGSRYGSRILLPENSAAGNAVMVSSGVTAHNTESVHGKENITQRQKTEEDVQTESHAQAVGTARAFHPVLVQGQAAQPVVDAAQPAVGANTVPPVTVQEQTAQSAAKTNNAQSVMVSGKGVQPTGEKRAVQAGSAGVGRTAVQKSASQPVGNGKPLQAAQGQKQPTVQSAEASLPVQPQAVRSQPVQNKTASADALPIKPAESYSLPIQPGMAASAVPAGNELPVRASQSNAIPAKPETAGNAAALADTLPAEGKSSAAGETKSSVQGAMALLGGQNFQTAQTEVTSLSAAGLPAVSSMPASAAQPAGQALPASGSAAQGEAVSRYTPDMPVEEILKLMTFEEAEKVVVDIGVCKGMTMAEVAERRTPSLKFYLYGGYKGNNNILRAAAQIMLDSLELQKAG